MSQSNLVAYRRGIKASARHYFVEQRLPPKQFIRPSVPNQTPLKNTSLGDSTLQITYWLICGFAFLSTILTTMEYSPSNQSKILRFSICYRRCWILNNPSQPKYEKGTQQID